MVAGDGLEPPTHGLSSPLIHRHQPREGVGRIMTPADSGGETKKNLFGRVQHDYMEVIYSYRAVGCKSQSCAIREAHPAQFAGAPFL